MRKTTRKVVLVGVSAFCLAMVPVVSAFYSALQVRTDMNVKEPLSFRSVSIYSSGGGNIPCVRGNPPTTAVCTGSAFAGEFFRIFAQVHNAASVPLVLRASINSSSPDVVLEAASCVTLAKARCPERDGGFEVGSSSDVHLTFQIRVSPSAAPVPVYVTATVSR